jgi:hypothetical protein
LKIWTRLRAYVARLTRRIISSVFPENMDPTMTVSEPTGNVTVVGRLDPMAPRLYRAPPTTHG